MKPPPLSSNRPRGWSAAVVLFAGIGLTLFTTYYASRTIKLRTQARFQAAVEQTRAAIQNRVEGCVALLRGGAGLFAVEPRLSRKQFQIYVDRLRLPTNYPGLQGIGVSVRVAPEEKEAIVSFMQKQGVTNFHIWPASDRPEYHPILYLEPLDKRNQAAIGYDMFTEPTRREAMERARDEGMPIASRRVVLIQEIEEPKQWGFLIYVPVYAENTIPTTIAERRASLRGFAYSPFRSEDLFRAILTAQSATSSLDLQIFDGTQAINERLLYQSSVARTSGAGLRPHYKTTVSVEVPGGQWTLRLAALPDFEGDWYVVPLLLLGGTTLSLVLFYLTHAEARALWQAEDTTARLRAADQALRENEQWLRLMVESAQDYAIFSLDSAGCIASWNAGAERLFGFSTSEIKGRSGEVIFTADDRASGAPDAELKQALETGAAQHERWHVRKDGSRLYVSGVVRPMRDAQGRNVGFIKVARDITTQLRARESLLREKQLSDAIINSLPGIFYLIDHRGKFLRWNRTLEEVSGYNTQEIAGMCAWDFFRSEARPAVEERIREVFATGEAIDEADLLTKEGRSLLYLLTGRRFDLEGTPCFVGMGLDISERKASEEALREARAQLQRYAVELEQRVAERTAKLEQSLQSLEGVLYHVAHDLRAPLRAMAGFTNILSDDYQGALDTRARDYIARITDAAQRMEELVQALLAYGRLGHMAMPTTRVDLEAVVGSAVNYFSEEVKKRRAIVEVQRPLPPVKANASVLIEVIANLLSNALKFVPPETAPQVRIWAQDGPLVRLWVQDNGIGIKPEYHDRIFRMFERLHRSDLYPGTGIGLAIVRKGIERLGGRVGVESAAGEGSRFWVELPAPAPGEIPGAQQTADAQNT